MFSSSSSPLFHLYIISINLQQQESQKNPEENKENLTFLN